MMLILVYLKYFDQFIKIFRLPKHQKLCIYIMSNSFVKIFKYSKSPLARMFIYLTNQDRIILTYNYHFFLFKGKSLLLIFYFKQNLHICRNSLSMNRYVHPLIILEVLFKINFGVSVR